jgi:hypothetical protein
MADVLIACEYSGEVRRAMRDMGLNAWSCDLLPAEDGDMHHIAGDVMAVLLDSWDAVIAFPPCTHLCVSGARWFKDKQAEQAAAMEFFIVFARLTIPHAIENPVGIMSTRYRKPDQIIQPWQFGHGETKATCLWLHKLPKLVPTDVVEGREARVHRMPPGPNRGRERSRTYRGIARAMAAQWAPILLA